MKLLPVQSSNIVAVGYDQDKQTLYVQFKNGATWRYSEVPAEVYEQMMAADSVGSFYARNIKSNYKGEKETQQ